MIYNESIKTINTLVHAEARILDLLKNHPAMPASLSIRPFAESLKDSGQPSTIDNLTVRYKGTTYITDSYTSDNDFSLKAIHTWEIMLEIRDARGHTPVLVLIPLISFLLSGFDVGTHKPLKPQSAGWANIDENNFRMYVMTFSHEELICEMVYYDSREAPPECEDNCFDGITDEGINICWRRKYDRVAGRYRVYNRCAEDLGLKPGNYPQKDFEIVLGIWRNTASIIPGIKSNDKNNTPYAVIPYKDPSYNRSPQLLGYVPEDDEVSKIFPTVFITTGSQILTPGDDIILDLYMSAEADTTVVLKITQEGSNLTPELLTGFSLTDPLNKQVSFSPAYNVDPGSYSITLKVELVSGWARLPNNVGFINIEYQYTVGSNS